jgi:hypothetical protein
LKGIKMKRTERDVYYYDLKVDSRAKLAPIPKLSEIASVWIDTFRDENCIILRDIGTIKYRIGDIQLKKEDDLLEILIRRSDVNAPDPAFSNFKTGKLRIAKKHAKEAGDTGAHLIVSLKPEKNNPNTYLCMLEGMPYISHSIIPSILNTITRYACKSETATFEYEDPSGARTRTGDPKMRSHQPKIELNGHMAENFKEDIERGEIRGLELIQRRGQIQLGSDPYLIEDLACPPKTDPFAMLGFGSKTC